MAFRPQAGSSTPSLKGEFEAILPNGGPNYVVLGLMVDFGLQTKYPKYSKDSAGKIVYKDGSPLIVWPHNDFPDGNQVGLYWDFLEQVVDYPGIGKRHYRAGLHRTSAGLSNGVNFTLVPALNSDGSKKVGVPSSIPSLSVLAKISAVGKTREGVMSGRQVMQIDSPNHNNIECLVGLICNVDVDIQTREYKGVKYHNVKLGNPAQVRDNALPGIPANIVAPVLIHFDDKDLLEEREDLGGTCKVGTLRKADIRRITQATNFPGSNMQKALVEFYGEDAVSTWTAEGKSAIVKMLQNDKEYQSIIAANPNGKPTDGAASVLNKMATLPKPSAPVEDDNYDNGNPF